MANYKPRILIVDDEPEIRELFRDVLEGEGYECALTVSGEDALQTLAAEDVDLALVDILMPGMSGIELFDKMRQRHPEVSVVFVTAMHETYLAAEAMARGAQGYLNKPLSLTQLLETVKESLRSRERRS